MLVHFPVALWTMATAAYVAAAAGLGQDAVAVAKWSNGVALIIAILAMVAGALELRSIEGRGEAMQVATWHMMVMATVWVCFVMALVLPMATGVSTEYLQLSAAAAAGVGFLLMAVGGWLGGRLVYEFGVGMKDRTK